MRFSALRLALLAACAVGIVATASAGAEDRTSRRSAAMALPDPYLDPSWPDQAGEEMDGRYAPGKSDSVEEVPLGEEREMQEELRAIQELTGAAPPAAAATNPPPPAAVATPGAPMEPDPSIPQDDVEEAPDLDQRDPVEW
jgi:hypothetical protein